MDEPTQQTQQQHDDATDPTQAIANAPRFLGERQPLPDELQLLEDFQRLLDESHVELPRRYVSVEARLYLLVYQAMAL